MFFTQDDYKKIQQWLTKNSVKDTEFNEANIPFNGEETITIVQGNQNKKVFLKDLIAQVFNLGISDFVNITDKYDAPNISLEEAIRLIPSRARKEGQVITFLDRENHWHIYQFKGVLNQWNVLDTWEDLFDWEKLIIDSILPDEEDLTKSSADENGNSYLSLKDREYNPEDFSGLGRVILRKNIVEIEDPIYGKVKKNYLYQGMFTQSNTVYECRYDFDLNGQDITLPDNSYIEYNGGSISNGNIIDIAKGLNRIILRKNIKEGKNILTQDKINKENTIYEIRYDFDLNGSEITIPEGCVLDFQGGSLNNGVTISNNTMLWNPILKEVELYGKIYNTFGQEISHYNWDVIDHKCKLFTYIIPWNDIISDVQAAYSIGITNFYAILHITSNENSKFSIKDPYYVSDEYFVNIIKKYNIHVPYLKLHIDEGINMRNSPYNSSSYVNNVVAYIKQLVTSYKNMGLTFEKVWVSNEHLPLTQMNEPVEGLWRDKLLDLQIWLEETIGAECWASLQQPALCISSRNDINISTNYYPRISSLETNEFYTSQISDMLCRQLESYTNNMPKQKEYIISECGCSGRPFSLAVPEHYSLAGDRELYRLRIFYNTIVDAINKHGNISSFCLFYIEVFTANIEFRKDIYNILKKLR